MKYLVPLIGLALIGCEELRPLNNPTEDEREFPTIKTDVDVDEGTVVGADDLTTAPLEVCRDEGFASPQCALLRKTVACSLYKPYCGEMGEFPDSRTPNRGLRLLEWVGEYDRKGCRNPELNGTRDEQFSCELLQKTNRFCSLQFDAFLEGRDGSDGGVRSGLDFRNEVRELIGLEPVSDATRAALRSPFDPNSREWNEREKCNAES